MNKLGNALLAIGVVTAMGCAPDSDGRHDSASFMADAVGFDTSGGGGRTRPGAYDGADPMWPDSGGRGPLGGPDSGDVEGAEPDTGSGSDIPGPGPGGCDGLDSELLAQLKLYIAEQLAIIFYGADGVSVDGNYVFQQGGGLVPVEGGVLGGAAQDYDSVSDVKITPVDPAEELGQGTLVIAAQCAETDSGDGYAGECRYREGQYFGNEGQVVMLGNSTGVGAVSNGDGTGSVEFLLESPDGSVASLALAVKDNVCMLTAGVDGDVTEESSDSSAGCIKTCKEWLGNITQQIQNLVQAAMQ